MSRRVNELQSLKVGNRNWKEMLDSVKSLYAEINTYYLNECERLQWDRASICGSRFFKPVNQCVRTLENIFLVRVFPHMKENTKRMEPPFYLFISKAGQGAQDEYAKHVYGAVNAAVDECLKETYDKYFIFLDSRSMGNPALGRSEDTMYSAALRCKEGISILSQEYLKRGWPLCELLIFNCRLQENELEKFLLTTDPGHSSVRPSVNGTAISIRDWIAIIKPIVPSIVREFPWKSSSQDSEREHIEELIKDVVNRANEIARHMQPIDQGQEQEEDQVFNHMKAALLAGARLLKLKGIAFVAEQKGVNIYSLIVRLADDEDVKAKWHRLSRENLIALLHNIFADTSDDFLSEFHKIRMIRAGFCAVNGLIGAVLGASYAPGIVPNPPNRDDSTIEIFGILFGTFFGLIVGMSFGCILAQLLSPPCVGFNLRSGYWPANWTDQSLELGSVRSKARRKSARLHLLRHNYLDNSRAVYSEDDDDMVDWLRN